MGIKNVKQLMQRFGGSRAGLLLIVALVLLMGIVFSYKIISQSKFDQKEVQAAIAKSDCPQFIDKYKGVKSSTSDVSGSIELLANRGRCYSNTQQYSRAERDFTELAKFQRLANDENAAKVAESLAADAKSNQENPVKVTPSTQKGTSVDSFNGFAGREGER